MSVFDKGPDILEVTLRDGSYLIDFQFTAEDTATIASALDSIGFRWIEVGHGVGLNASAKGKGHAAATDEEYLEAAAQAVRTARWGMFFIPDIGRAEDLRLAARYHMDFVRIGTNVSEIEQARPFFTLAKELGLIVSYNAMKTYAISPTEFGRYAALAQRWGADIVCVVDSAGGMYPDDVSAYLKAAQSETDVALGFHGHDNLSLAMANTLRAIECGAVLVDSSLQGIGRSAGNAVTEVLVAVLKQRGHLADMDLKAVMDVGQSLIQPTLRRRGLDPMAITAGYARFHSSFTAKVQAYAQEHHLDVRDLIIRLCQEDQIDAPDALLERLSQELAAHKMPRVLTVPAFGVKRPKPERGPEALPALLKEIRPRAAKAGKFAALNLVLAEDQLPDFLVSGNIQNTQAHIVGSVTYTTEEHLTSILQRIDGAVDVVLLDIDRKPFGPRTPAQLARAHLHKSMLLTYSDSRVWVNAVEDQVVRLLTEILDQLPVVIAGNHPKSRALALHFAERGARVSVLGGTGEQACASDWEALSSLSQNPACLEISYVDAHSKEASVRLSEARLVVVWPKDKAWFGKQQARHLRTATYVLDSRIGALLPDGLEEARRRGALLMRVNIWPTLAGVLSAAHESARLCQEAMGWETLAGVPVVAAGAMGQRGDVIVDNVREPARIIGVADGRGGVLYNYAPDEAERVLRVSQEINRRLILPAVNRD